MDSGLLGHETAQTPRPSSGDRTKTVAVGLTREAALQESIGRRNGDGADADDVSPYLYSLGTAARMTTKWYVMEPQTMVLEEPAVADDLFLI